MRAETGAEAFFLGLSHYFQLESVLYPFQKGGGGLAMLTSSMGPHDFHELS